MIKTSRLATTALVVLMAAGPALANPVAPATPPAFTPVPAEIATPDDGTLAVTGSATIDVSDLRASISFGVSATAKLNAQDAYDEVNKKVDRIRKVLGEHGVDPKDLTTNGLNLSMDKDRNGKDNGYTMSYRISIADQTPAALSKAIPALVEAGANGLSGLSIQAANEDELRTELSLEAAANARHKAERYARAMDLDITGIRTIQPISNYGPRPMNALAMKTMAAPASMPIETGAGQLTETVQATFTVRLHQSAPSQAMPLMGGADDNIND